MRERERERERWEGCAKRSYEERRGIFYSSIGKQRIEVTEVPFFVLVFVAAQPCSQSEDSLILYK